MEQIRKCWSQSKQLQEKRGAEQWELDFPNEGKETHELLKDKPSQQRDREGQQQDERPQPSPQKEDVTPQVYEDLRIDIKRGREV